MKAAKPIIHGRDHAPGGADVIPGLADLIASAGGGDYVFLQEVIVTDTEQDTIEFTDISQDYEHLVLECSLQTPGSSTVDDLWVDWGFPTVGYAGDKFRQIQRNLVGATVLDEDDVGDDTNVFVKGILPSHATVGANGLAAGHVFAQITFKFGFYSIGDRASVVTWQGVSDVLRSGGSGVEDTVMSYTAGGGAQSGYAAAIDRIRLACADGFGADSRAALYGIKNGGPGGGGGGGSGIFEGANTVTDLAVTASSGSIALTASSGDIELTSGSAYVAVASGGNLAVGIAAGTSLQVQDHLGAPIFQVDEDGTIHTKSGVTAFTDDL